MTFQAIVADGLQNIHPVLARLAHDEGLHTLAGQRRNGGQVCSSHGAGVAAPRRRGSGAWWARSADDAGLLMDLEAIALVAAVYVFFLVVLQLLAWDWPVHVYVPVPGRYPPRGACSTIAIAIAELPGHTHGSVHVCVLEYVRTYVHVILVLFTIGHCTGRGRVVGPSEKASYFDHKGINK